MIARVGCVLLTGLVVGLPSAARADLLDFLFGGYGRAPRGYQYEAPPSYQPEHPSVRIRVRPAPTAYPGSGQHGQVVSATAPPSLTVPKQRSINPERNPDWFLRDPTLAAGDIVILRSGTFVFNGRRAPTGLASREDFVRLNLTNLVSPGERDRVQKMTGPNETDAKNPPAPVL